MQRKRHLLCHLFLCTVTRLLCSCSLFQDLTWDIEKRTPILQFWSCPQQITASKFMAPIYLGCSPWYISSDLCSAYLGSGKLHFPLRNKCKWISTIMLYSVAFGLHTLPSLCFMSKTIQQLSPKFRNKQRLLKGLLEGRKWTKVPFVKRENK